MRIRLLPDWSPLGWTPFAWLVYLSFFLVYAIWNNSPRDWLIDGPAVALFLVLYFRGFWLHGRALLGVIFAIVFIGMIVAPRNPGATPMAPVDLSKFTSIAFWARGDGGTHQVMVFAARLGNIPATRPFTPGPEWREFVLPLASFSNIDGSDLRGVLFSAGSKPGPFRFTIDDVRFR